MDLELIRANENDKQYLFNLRKLTMVEHLEKAGLYLSDDEHLLRLNENYDCLHLIINAGKRLGAVKYQMFEEKLIIMQIQVHPSFQGKGIGKLVMQQLISLAKLRDVELSVLKDNPAQLLYQRLGFVAYDEDEYEIFMRFRHLN